MRYALGLLLLLAPQDADLKPPFTFAAYGDCRSGHDVHRKICQLLVTTDAKFAIQSGDLVYSGNSEKDWEMWREITKELREKMPLWSAKGNHDRGKAGTFETEFKLEKNRAYYDKRLGNVHFFFIDTNSSMTPQIKWLEEAVPASKAAHKVAVFHEPPFTLVTTRTKDAEKVAERVHGTLTKLRFCGAICGHDHMFYATRRDGVMYVITGGGGAPLYDLEEKLAGEGDLYRKIHHYILCTAEEKSVAMQVYDLEGKAVDGLKFAMCEHRQ